MPTHACHCGARYRFPEASLGKRAKCKQCGSVFTLGDEAGPIPIAADPYEEPAVSPRHQAAVATLPSTGSTSPANDREQGLLGTASSVPLAAERGPAKGYFDSVLWTVLFPAAPGDLLTFLLIWLVYGVLGVLPFISFLALAWYSAFRFEIVESAAAGEEGLPNLTIGADVWSDFIDPVIRWIASWIIVMAPAFVHAVTGMGAGSTSVREALEALGGGLSGVFQALGADPVLVVLIGLGLFFWPMVVLCLALGGFGAAFRIDLMAITIARAFPGYAVTILLLIGATAGEHFLRDWAANRLAPAAGAGLGAMLTSALVLGFLITGASIYADIVAMRSIGLYYRHFKDRFAWRWE